MNRTFLLTARVLLALLGAPGAALADGEGPGEALAGATTALGGAPVGPGDPGWGATDLLQVQGAADARTLASLATRIGRGRTHLAGVEVGRGDAGWIDADRLMAQGRADALDLAFVPTRNLGMSAAHGAVPLRADPAATFAALR